MKEEIAIDPALRQAIDVWAKGRPWTLIVQDGKAEIVCDDGVRASIWLDAEGQLHSCELPPP